MHFYILGILILHLISVFIILFKKQSRIYLYLTIFAFVLFLIHFLLIFTVGFQKPYSYAMDVAVSLIYLLIISNNWKNLLRQNA